MSAERVSAFFHATFGTTPTLIVSAPGRVNLIGEHTDYNGGDVLPIAIEYRTWVAARPTASDRVRVVSATQTAAGEFATRKPERGAAWWDYVAGMAAQLGARGSVAGCDLAVWSDLPTGAGLSSSAALELACGAALAQASGIELPRRELALLAQSAEHEFVGVQCGIMDQFACALAREQHALHIRCASLEITHLPMREAVLVFDTAIPRALRRSAYNERREECERALELLRRARPDLASLAEATVAQVAEATLPPPLDRRTMHVVTETARVRQVARALGAGELVPGDVLLASHDSLRERYECSTPELDWFVERAMREPAVRGARLTGAGWGGCAIAMGDAAALVAAAPALAADYAQRFGRTPRVWVTRAAAGAAIESRNGESAVS